MKRVIAAATILGSSMSCRTPQQNEGSLESTSPQQQGILADHDRDGKIGEGDRAITTWSWNSGGAFMMADIVDANRNRIPDSQESGPRNAEMLKQFVTLRIEKSGSVEFTHDGGEHILVYSDDGQRQIKSGDTVNGPVDLKIAAKYFAGMNNFSGYVKFSAKNAEGKATTTVRVAPWIMLPNSAKTKKVYISQGAYASAVQPYSTSMWEEMWMQDTLEIGYQEVPGKGVQYAILQADRCPDKECDRFAMTLLDPNTGVFRVKAQPRKKYGKWDDWYGNLEVSHPTAAWPHGRIYFGKNLNDNLAKVLHKQEVQKPFILDPTWLLIKHVDEFLNFLTDSQGQPKIMVTSPRRASEISGSPLNRYNQDIQWRIDRDLQTALTAVGLTESDVIHLPMLYSPGGENDWSSPVNSIHLDRKIAVGNTTKSGPRTLAQTAYGKDIERSLSSLGLRVLWTDDRAYQPNHGNVHCGTNTLKEPLFRNFWTMPVKG
jgi:Protein-arginine deiminase (PAD)